MDQVKFETEEVPENESEKDNASTNKQTENNKNYL